MSAGSPPLPSPEAPISDDAPEQPISSLVFAALLGEGLEVASGTWTDPELFDAPPRNGDPAPELVARALGIDEEDVEELIAQAGRTRRQAASRFEGPSDRTYLLSVHPCGAPGGTAEKSLLTLHDLTEWQRTVTDATLFREIVRRLPGPFLVLDAAGLIHGWNAGASRVYGYARQEVVHRLALWDLMPTEDRAKVQRFLERVQEEPWVDAVESRRIRKDGHTIDVLSDGVRITHRGQRRLCLLETDVSLHREIERRRELYARELDHRVKNTLSGVQAIVDGVLRSAGEVDPDLQRRLRTRLHAYARAHRALSANRWEGLPLRNMVTTMLAPYDGGRVEVTGSDGFVIRSDLTAPLALTLHELLSNAIAHGALSVPEGRVSLSWEGADEPGQLTLAWVERGGPPVSEPSRYGFGVNFILGALPFQADANVDLRFLPEGVSCLIRLPLAPIEASERPE